MITTVANSQTEWRVQSLLATAVCHIMKRYSLLQQKQNKFGGLQRPCGWDHRTQLVKKYHTSNLKPDVCIKVLVEFLITQIYLNCYYLFSCIIISVYGLNNTNNVRHKTIIVTIKYTSSVANLNLKAPCTRILHELCEYTTKVTINSVISFRQCY